MVEPHVGRKLAELLTVERGGFVCLHHSGDGKHREDLVHNRDNRICRDGVHDLHYSVPGVLIHDN